MTEAQARATLKAKLEFGNDKQIRARKFLENLALLEERYKNCNNGPHDSVGEACDCECMENQSEDVKHALALRLGDDECPVCDGDGYITCPTCDGSGIAN